MTAVEHLYAPPKTEPASLRRIRLLSIPFEIVFALLASLAAALFVTLAAVALFYQGDNFRLTHEGPTLYFANDRWPADSVRVADAPLWARLTGIAAAFCIQGPLIAGFVGLYKLFGCYRRGIVFAQEPIRWMRRAGALLIAYALAPGLLQPVVQAAGLMDRNWLHGHSLASLIVGAALFVLAQVIALGREIEKEGEGYI